MADYWPRGVSSCLPAETPHGTWWRSYLTRQRRGRWRLLGARWARPAHARHAWFDPDSSRRTRRSRGLMAHDGMGRSACRHLRGWYRWCCMGSGAPRLSALMTLAYRPVWTGWAVVRTAWEPSTRVRAALSWASCHPPSEVLAISSGGDVRAGRAGTLLRLSRALAACRAALLRLALTCGVPLLCLTPSTSRRLRLHPCPPCSLHTVTCTYVAGRCFLTA